jgi:hypothetical protein
LWTKGIFGSVVVVAFQITFRAEMHANDFFLFFKNHFWHQHIKTIQNVQTVLNFSKKKKLNFIETQFQPHSQTLPKIFFSYLNISPVEKDTVYYHPQTVMFVARKELVCKIRKQSRIQSWQQWIIKSPPSKLLEPWQWIAREKAWCSSISSSQTWENPSMFMGFG